MENHNNFVGIDLGDKKSQVCVTDAAGTVVAEFPVATARGALVAALSRWPQSRVALETGTHSLWTARALSGAGHAVVVADARKVALIHGNIKKSDVVDARTLARLVRLDVGLLSPVHVRSEKTQGDLGLLRARDALVGVRTALINHVRGAVKSYGERLNTCGADAFVKKVTDQVPDALRPALSPLLEQIALMTAQIKAYDQKIASVSEEYPALELLRSVPGVGPLTALAYVLTLESAARFTNARHVGAYLGLVPRRDQSGERDPQLRITKAGDGFMRRLLVNAAQYILGHFGPDTKLRRWGLAKATGGKRAKRIAIIAVARKLAVLLHTLWTDGAHYQAFPPSSTPNPAQDIPQPALT